MDFLPDYISSKIVVDPDTGCWDYTGYCNKWGYGHTKYRGKHSLTHRISYQLFHKKRSIKGKMIRHRCDRPACCNPEHLVSGTHADNVKDRVKRKRSAVGMRNGRAKLRPSQVLVIAGSSMTHIKLAQIYGVDRSLIADIKKKRVWKYLWARN